MQETSNGATRGDRVNSGLITEKGTFTHGLDLFKGLQGKVGFYTTLSLPLNRRHPSWLNDALHLEFAASQLSYQLKSTTRNTSAPRCAK